ncbi:lipoate--protein ligase family protein [Thermithiobacillus plumbiphilus]|uniref:Lipoate--protein ligase family protein n=1 Tax=Thermithiobacillus plumbiphilus TaxID=1729899 RepID=A0ABU9D6X3_9PROT
MTGALPARWIDLGDLAPLDLHAAYIGIATAQDPEAAPVVLWGRSATPHLSLGASQNAEAELDLAACEAGSVPWIRRPLGGGTVLVDDRQFSFFVILPRAYAPGRPALRPHEIFPLLAPAMLETFQAFGLAAGTQGNHDFWVNGRKIAGTGAGMIGACQVFTSSFMLDFDAERFTQLVAVPSAGFRQWLLEGLCGTMTSWRQEGVVPDPAPLAAAFQRALTRTQGWGLEASEIRPLERDAIAEARATLADDQDADWQSSVGGSRRVPWGIKLNAGSFLTERRWGSDWLRILTQLGRIGRLAGSGALDQGVISESLLGLPVSAEAIMPVLRRGMADELARRWTERILETAFVSDRNQGNQ